MDSEDSSDNSSNGEAPRRLVPCCCLAPGEAVGLIVGRGGATLRKIEAESGAEIYISGEEDTPPTLGDRIVRISGELNQKEDACRQIIRAIHEFVEVAAGERGIFVLLIPSSAAGCVVGQNGSVISTLMELSGADIKIGREPVVGTEMTPVSITGTLGQTLTATGRIDQILQQLFDKGRLDGDFWQPAQAFRGRPASSRAPPLRVRSRSSGEPPLRVRSRSSGEPRLRGRSTSSGPSGGIARGTSRSDTPGRRSTATPGRSDTPGRRSTATLTTASRSTTPGRLRQSGSYAVRFVVSANAAAWVVGREGRSINQIRESSGAAVDVAKRDDASSRMVLIRGGLQACQSAAGLVVKSIFSLPRDPPRDVRLLVPADASSAHEFADALAGLPESTGAQVGLEDAGPGGDRVLVISGNQEEMVQAVEDIADVLAQASPTEPSVAPASTSRTIGPSGTFRAILQRPSQQGLASDAVAVDAPHRHSQHNLPSAAVLGEAPQRASQSRLPSDAVLLKALLAGPGPCEAQIRLFLPRNFARNVLEADGLLGAVAARSGSRLEFGEVASGDAVRGALELLTISGTMMGNAMAVYYIQDLVLRHGANIVCVDMRG